MSNVLTLQSVDVSAIRLNKAGQITATRNIIGVMSSGNRQERDAVINSMFSAAWLNGHFAPMAAECGRVYGKMFADFVKHPAINMDVSTGTLPKHSPISNRQAWEAFFAHLNKHDTTATNAKLELTPFKSEKRRYLDAINNALTAFKMQADIYAAEKLAAAAALDASNTEIGATVTDGAVTSGPALEFVAPVADFVVPDAAPLAGDFVDNSPEAQFPGLAALATADVGEAETA